MNARKLGTIGAVVALATAVFALLVPSASAATKPPWEPDPQALGTIAFYDSSGAVITSGSDLSNLFSYAEASNDSGPAGTTKAQVSWAFPKSGENTGLWFVASAASASRYPNSSAPAPLNTTTNPLVSATASNAESDFKAVSGQGTNDTTAGYNDMIQVRLGTTGPGGVGTGSGSYWATDIMVNYQANTWTQVYPAPAAGPTSTTTQLSAMPSSPQNAGTSVTFKATVTPSAAAGTVQFADGTTDLGSPVAVSSGTATYSTSALTSGAHSITATFTPTSAAAYNSSTSAALPYTITTVATSTSTKLSVSPTSPITSGTRSTLTATVTPSSAAGSIRFYDGATALGAAVPVSGGTASSAPQTLSVNTHQLTAVFTPTSVAAFTGSTSPVVSYVVDPQPATSTTTGLSIMPAGPQTYGTSLALSATVTPSAAVGTVNFLDGSTVIASKAVSGGAASITSSALAGGTHTITASFVPTDAATYGASSSAPQVYTVTPAASSVGLGVAPASSAEQGSTVTLTATTGPSGTGGSVQFFDGTTSLGTANVTSNSARITTASLGLGGHTLSATFTPSGTDYSAATSSNVPYTITPIPPADTTTALAVTPSSPVAPGTDEKLTATVTPAAAAGTVTFLDGATQLGSAAVSGGKATLSQVLGQGTHSLTAMFLPTDSTKYNDSNSAASPVSYTVLPPAAATATGLTVAPGSSEPYGTVITLKSTVMPAAAGTVTFRSGSTVLGSAAVTSGAATVKTTGIPGGSYELTATFSPSAPLYFAGSTSSAAPLTITTIKTTAALTIAPAGPVTKGAAVTLTGTITPQAAAGTVTFRSGTTVLGSARVSTGTAILRTTGLPIGTDSITASFAATDSADFESSTSAPLTIKVVAPPTITAVYSGSGKVIESGASVPQHSSLQVHAAGFQPYDSILVTLHSTTITIGRIRATAAGTASANVVLPSNLTLGTHHVEFAGSVGSASFTFRLVRSSASTTGDPSGTGVDSTSTASSSSGSDLASTGADVALGLIGGLVLLGAGVLLVQGGRARYRGLHR